MKKLLLGLTLSLVVTGSALAADDHSYQVTGPILAVTDTSITVQKGKEPWTVSRDANTKITGNLAVGSKVTIKYHMTADSATVK